MAAGWKDEMIVVFCARLNHIQQWSLIRMMDIRGKNSGATLPARFDMKDIPPDVT
jgi:phosphatidylinositol phospholipase C delta